MSHSNRTARQRPQLVTWFALGVLTLAAFNLAGWVAGLGLPDLPYSVPRAYLLLRNALWAVWGALSALLAFQGRRSSPSVVKIGGLFVLAWYWADRLWLVRSEYTRNRWTVAAMFSALALAMVAVIFSRPAVRNYFQETDS